MNFFCDRTLHVEPAKRKQFDAAKKTNGAAAVGNEQFVSLLVSWSVNQVNGSR